MLKQLSTEISLSILRNGGVIVVPTETAYALAVDATNEAAVQKLYTLKKRALDKPIFIMVDSLEMAKQYGDFSRKAREFAALYWPGALTLVVSKHNNPPQPSLDAREGVVSLAQNLNVVDDTIGIRWTSNPIAQEIITKFGKPITATSANVSGEDSCYTVAEIEEQFSATPELGGVVDGGNLPKGELSTIVRVKKDEITILRKGKIIL